MREATVEQALVRGIREAGGWALKLVSPGHAGVPDRLVLMPGGRVIFVELKTEKGKLSPLQIETHKRLASLFMEVWTLYGMDDVKWFIKYARGGDPNAFQALSVSASSRGLDSDA